MIDYIVQPAKRESLEFFIEKWHYSGNLNGVISDYCFELLSNDRINRIGAAVFGRMAMANQWKPFADEESHVIELRRLCCIDETPKNTESYFISRCLKWLEQNTHIKCVVSYADEEHGHSGIIYKASNFEYFGFKAGAKIILWQGKRYHDKTIRTKYKGQLKPFAVSIIKAIESGEAIYQETAGKHCYIRKLKNKCRKKQFSLFDTLA